MLLGYQQRWMKDRSRVRVAEKSRRIGWSWTMAAESVIESARSHGMDHLYIGYNQEMAREFIEDAAEFACEVNQAAGAIEEVVLQDPDKDIIAFRIVFCSGFKILALSSKPSNLRGRQGHAILDEAAFHDDLDGLIKAAMAFLMWGGRVSIISTHNGVDNPFNQLCEDIRAGRVDYSLHRVTLDDALQDGLYQRICARLGQDWSVNAEDAWRAELIGFYGEHADEELFCVPRKSGGSYLSRGLVEERMHDAPVLSLEYKAEFATYSETRRRGDTKQWIETNLRPLVKMLPSGNVTHLGQDYGRVSDLSVIAPITTEQNLKGCVPFIIEMSKVPIDQQRQILWWLIDAIPKFGGIAMDATGNGQAIAELTWQKYGETRVEMVTMSDKWYAENLPPFKAAFEDDRISVPRNTNILSDLAAFQVINGIPKLPKVRTKDADGKTRHADSAIALVLAHYASKTINESFGYKAVRQEDYRHGRRVKVTHGIRGRKGLI